MRVACLVSVVGFGVACGDGYSGDRAKTPDEIIAEQERLAAKDERRRQSTDTGPIDDSELEADKRAKFDKRQSQIELKRATRSAVTCPGSIGTEEELPAPTVTVTLTFANAGHVKEATIDQAFQESKIGKCVLRAMHAVIVPPFHGAEVQVPWTINFSEGESSGESEEE